LNLKPVASDEIQKDREEFGLQIDENTLKGKDTNRKSLQLDESSAKLLGKRKREEEFEAWKEALKKMPILEPRKLKQTTLPFKKVKRSNDDTFANDNTNVKKF